MKIERTFGKMTFWAVLLFAVIVMFDVGTATPAKAASLTPDEEADLIFQREEEKLAHDVYLRMYEKWGAAIFSNILVSEERHMDTMLKMLNKNIFCLKNRKHAFGFHCSGFTGFYILAKCCSA